MEITYPCCDFDKSLLVKEPRMIECQEKYMHSYLDWINWFGSEKTEKIAGTDNAFFIQLYHSVRVALFEYVEKQFANDI